MTVALETKFGSIAFVVDERLSRQKSALLTRVVNSIRTCTQKLELITGPTTEEEMLARLELNHYDLVLVPWYRYLNWSKIEGFHGLTRTTGPTFAGYFCDNLLPYEVGEQKDHYRALLLDFAQLETPAIKLIIRSVLQDTRRSGLRPLLGPSTPIYGDAWPGGQTLGAALESVLKVPELQMHEWSKRLPAVRLCLTALWSMVFEEGPGKAEARFANPNRVPRAYIQAAADQGALTLRLYTAMPTWTPRDALAAFWPGGSRGPTSPYQLLTRYADFVRVHSVPEPADLEVTAVFFPGTAAEQAFNHVHTLWVEPLAAHVIAELPFDLPGQPRAELTDPLRRLMPNSGNVSPAAAQERANHTALKARKFILEASDKIRELKAQLEDRDEKIAELRSGGVGTARPLPPPDMEGILDAFEEKYHEAKFQLRTLEEELARREGDSAPREELEAIRRKINAAQAREQNWLRKISGTFEAFREASLRRKKGGGQAA